MNIFLVGIIVYIIDFKKIKILKLNISQFVCCFFLAKFDINKLTKAVPGYQINMKIQKDV